MTTIDKVMEILNNSEESKRLNRMWKECEDKANLTEEERQQSGLLKMHFIIYQNKEAYNALAEGIYHDLRNEES